MSKLLGQMDAQLVGVYRQALMADLPSSVPMAEGLRGISDIKNVLSVIDATRRTIGATGSVPTDETGKDGKKKTGKTGDQRSAENGGEGGMTKEEIMELQQRIVDHFPEGEALPVYGVDGKLGDETREWIDKYNTSFDAAEARYNILMEMPNPPIANFSGVTPTLNQYFQMQSPRNILLNQEEYDNQLEGVDLPPHQGGVGVDVTSDPGGVASLGGTVGELSTIGSGIEYNENLRNSPLFKVDMQQQAPMIDVGTSLSQIKASNKVVGERIKATNGSLTSMHFNSIKEWHRTTLLIIENENDPQTIQQAIGIQNSLSALNERAKRLRSDYADVILNDEISNYAYDYFNFFISEYLSSTIKRMLAKNPNSGEYEYVFMSKREGRPIVMEEVEKNLRALTKDVASQSSILKQINTLTKVAKNVSKKQPGPQEFKSIALDIVKKGRITSLIYDDILNNASSFFEDVKEHPSFLKPDVAAFPELPREPGEFNWYDNISEIDYIEIYNIITDPGHPMFNYKSNPRSPIGITEVLLVDYIASYFESHYNKAKGTTDKKPTEMVDQQSPMQKKQPMTKRDILKKYNL